MKHKYLILFLPILIFSCTEYYFNEPQPVDSKNIYKVPNKFIGTWYIKDSMDITQEDFDSISIGKNFYHLIDRERIKEAKSKIDLDSNIFIIDNKIYFTEDGTLNGGFTFNLSNDTMIVNRVENKLVHFGTNAFLRKIDYGYILNTNHEKMIDWWRIIFIDTREKENILIRSIKDGDVENFPPYKTLNKKFNNYIKSKWTTVEIQDFIDKGGFSDTTHTLKYDEKSKK